MAQAEPTGASNSRPAFRERAHRGFSSGSAGAGSVSRNVGLLRFGQRQSIETMKTTLMCLAGLTFGIGLMDAGSPTAGTFLSSFGVCQFTNASSVTKLTIKANELQLTCSDETHHTSAGATSWSASRRWFVYVA